MIRKQDYNINDFYGNMGSRFERAVSILPLTST